MKKRIVWSADGRRTVVYEGEGLGLLSCGTPTRADRRQWAKEGWRRRKAREAKQARTTTIDSDDSDAI